MMHRSIARHSSFSSSSSFQRVTNVGRNAVNKALQFYNKWLCFDKLLWYLGLNRSMVAGIDGKKHDLSLIRLKYRVWRPWRGEQWGKGEENVISFRNPFETHSLTDKFYWWTPYASAGFAVYYIFFGLFLIYLASFRFHRVTFSSPEEQRQRLLVSEHRTAVMGCTGTERGSITKDYCESNAEEKNGRS